MLITRMSCLKAVVFLVGDYMSLMGRLTLEIHVSNMTDL